MRIIMVKVFFMVDYIFPIENYIEETYENGDKYKGQKKVL